MVGVIMVNANFCIVVVKEGISLPALFTEFPSVRFLYLPFYAFLLIEYFLLTIDKQVELHYFRWSFESGTDLVCYFGSFLG